MAQELGIRTPIYKLSRTAIFMRWEVEVTEDERKAKELAIRYVFPADVKTRYANHAVVQHTSAGEFFLSFFEIVHPLLVGEPEEIEKQSSEIGAIDAVCVGRIVISPEQAENFLSVMSTNFLKFKSRGEKSSEEDRHAS